MDLKEVLHINMISISLNPADLRGHQMQLHHHLVDHQADLRVQVQLHPFHRLRQHQVVAHQAHQDPLVHLAVLLGDPQGLQLGLKLPHHQWELDHQFHPRRAMAQTVHLVPLQVVRHRPLRPDIRASQWDPTNLGLRVREVPQIPTHTRDKGRQCIQDNLVLETGKTDTQVHLAAVIQAQVQKTAHHGVPKVPRLDLECLLVLLEVPQVLQVIPDIMGLILHHHMVNLLGA